MKQDQQPGRTSNRSRFTGKSRLGLMLVGVLVWAAASTHATLVSYVGIDPATQSGWRTVTTAKPLDADHNNIYGTLGYYLFSPRPTTGSDNASAGLIHTSPPNADQPGGVISTGATGLTIADYPANGYNLYWASYSTYPSIDDPTSPGGSEYAGYGYAYGGGGGLAADQPYGLFTLTVGSGLPSNFRLGLIRSGTLTNDFSVFVATSSDTNTVDLGGVSSSDLQYVFFDIAGANPGDTFTIGAITSQSGLGSLGLAGVTVDQIVPEPSVLALLSAGAVALAWQRRKKMV